jgi:hypothetical protein
MDPNATLAFIVDKTNDVDYRIAACTDLIEWLEAGGFMPILNGVLDAPSFGGNTAARIWLERKLAAIAAELETGGGEVRR